CFGYGFTEVRDSVLKQEHQTCVLLLLNRLTRLVLSVFDCVHAEVVQILLAYSREGSNPEEIRECLLTLERSDLDLIVRAVQHVRSTKVIQDVVRHERSALQRVLY